MQNPETLPTPPASETLAKPANKTPDPIAVARAMHDVMTPDERQNLLAVLPNSNGTPQDRIVWHLANFWGPDIHEVAKKHYGVVCETQPEESTPPTVGEKAPAEPSHPSYHALKRIWGEENLQVVIEGIQELQAKPASTQPTEL